ncbi:MAG: hypothetical protein IPO15_11420 [Anaerolineae bacterium]|uniref:hypothetical protein n=1 Tax=Candidatus Amarolinea dominans TaxID=3140696 RepID=UPI003136CFB3|nr:hypothetical protein [Anaerolineae bacterium]
MDEATRHDIRKRSTARERIWGALRIAAMVAIVSLWGVQVGPTSTSATSSVREDTPAMGDSVRAMSAQTVLKPQEPPFDPERVAYLGRRLAAGIL